MLHFVKTIHCDVFVETVDPPPLRDLVGKRFDKKTNRTEHSFAILHNEYIILSSFR